MTELTPERIVEVAFAFMRAKTLLSAVELGVFTELAREDADAATLRQRLGLHERSVRDFLDSLVALGLLEREGDRYRNTPEVDLFLDRTKPTYMGGLLEMMNARLYPFWGGLTDALRTGRPQNEIQRGGENLFEALYSDPARLRLFLQGMTGISLGAARAMAQKFPWDRYQTFVDVGTAQGGLPVQIARVHPHLTGIGFDLPVVRPIFEAYVASAGLGDRLRFQPGDFFREPLPGADVLVMGHILHDWNADEKRMLLAKAHAALPDGGALIVYEGIIDDDRRRNVFGLMMSLNMLIETQGGFDYTGADCVGWMREVGFRSAIVEQLTESHAMVVGTK